MIFNIEEIIVIGIINIELLLNLIFNEFINCLFFNKEILPELPFWDNNFNNWLEIFNNWLETFNNAVDNNNKLPNSNKSTSKPSNEPYGFAEVIVLLKSIWGFVDFFLIGFIRALIIGRLWAWLLVFGFSLIYLGHKIITIPYRKVNKK